MSSIPVPDIYRQSIFHEMLEIGQSRLEQTKIQCRQQLSMSHTLGSSVDGDANHFHLRQVDVESGRWTLSQGQQEIQVGTSSCKAFSIRGYVANVRETDISKCWPFHPHLLKKRMGENIVTLLPPLEVPTYRYWECSLCLDNELILDSPDKGTLSAGSSPLIIRLQNGTHDLVRQQHKGPASFIDDQQQPDNLTNAMPVNGDANLPTKLLSKNEYASSGNGIQNPCLRRNEADGLEEEETCIIEVAQCMKVDKRSGDASIENHKETLQNKDRARLHGTIKHLTSPKASDDDNLFSKYEIVACNATVWPTDSEETSSAKQSLSSKDDEHILSNCTSQMKAETYALSFTEKADHIKYMHCTVNKALLCEPSEDIFQENFENITAEKAMEKPGDNINTSATAKAMEKFISEIPGDNINTSATADNVDEEDCISKVENDGIPPIVKKLRAKRQNGKVKTLKKRSISDLIAVSPNEKVRCNETNWKFKLKHMSRRAKIEMWRISKAATYSSQKFKVPIKPNLESENDKRKLQCQGISCQSSPSEKSLKEARKVIKRLSGSKKLGSPRQEMLAKASRKQVPAEELVQNGVEKQAVSDPEDDLLNDLAHFMAKNQYQRHASTSTSRNLKETEFVKGSLIQNMEAEDGNCFVTDKLGKSGDPIELHNSHSLKDELVKGTDTFSQSSAEHATVDDEIHLLIEDGDKINQVQEPGKHERLETPGQAKEEEVISDTVIGTSTSSDHHACKNTQTVDRKLKRDASALSVSDKDSIGNNLMIDAQRNSGSCTLQKTPIEHLGNLLKSNCDQLSNIERSNAFVDAAVHGFSVIQDELVKGTDIFSYSSNKHARVDGKVHLLVEDDEKINEVQESGKHEKREMLGKARKEEVNTDTVIGTSSSSDHHACMNTHTFGYSSTQQATVDSEVHLLVEDGEKITQVQESGQAKQAEVNSDIVIGTSSSSDHDARKNTETVDGNLERDASAQLVNDKTNIGNDVMIKAQRTSGSFTSKKKSEHLGKLFNLNHDQLLIMDETNACLDAAIHDVSATSVEGYDNSLDESVPSNSCKDTLHSHNNGLDHSVPRNPCKDTSLYTSQTIAVTTFGPAQTNAAATDNIQTVVQPDLSPLNCRSRPTNPNMISDFENSASSNLKATQLYQTESWPKVNRDYTAFSAGYNSLLGELQKSMGETNFYTNLLLSSTDRDFTFESSGRFVEQFNNQVRQKQETCVRQTINTFPVLSGAGQQRLKILNSVPVKNISMEHRPSKIIYIQPSFDCNLPYNTMNPPSTLGAEPTADAPGQRPLRSPVILSFTQGNKLNTQTALSRECFDQGKFELQSYIENRIQNYCSGKAHERFVTSEAEKGHEDKDFQTAASQDPNLFILNKNLAEYLGLENTFTKQRKVKEVKQVQPDSSTAPPLVPSLSQTNVLGRSMGTSLDGQNHRKEMVAEACRGHSDTQTPFPGVNMNPTLENADEQIPKRRKVNKGKQTQIESQTSEPAVVAFSQTNLLKQKVDSQLKTLLRTGKSLDPACLKNNMHAHGPVSKRKYVKKAEKEATETKRKLDAESYYIQTEAFAMNNPTSQDLSSAANQFAGLKHVLKPIAQNTQRHLPVSPIPFPADQQGKEAVEARHAILKMNMSGPEKKRKSQSPAIRNSYDPRAIVNYIKWGTFSVDPPSSQALPTKVDADNTSVGIPYHTSNGNTFMPSSADNGEIDIPSYEGNDNGDIANPASAGNILGLLKPLGIYEQEALLYQVQTYLEKANIHLSSFTRADNPLSTSMDSPPEPNLTT